jgi:hypothetical protein
VLGEVLEARRERIIASRWQVDIVKWSCLFVQAMGTLAAIGMVRCDNRLAARIAMAIFATGVAVSLLLIVSHDRPFHRRCLDSARPAAAGHARNRSQPGMSDYRVKTAKSIQRRSRSL